MSDGSYNDKLKSDIATAVVNYLDEHPRLMSTDVEDVIGFDTPAEIRKTVLMSLQKQGLIRLKGDRRSAYYERVFKRRSNITINNQTIALFMTLYGYEGTRAVLHAIDPVIFPRVGNTDNKGLPFP